MILTINASPRENFISSTVAPKSTSKSVAGDIERAQDGLANIEAEAENFSALGRQLNGSAERASQRELAMSRNELAAYATAQQSKFLFDGYKTGKSRHDLETPQTVDPVLLCRAIRATQYVNCFSSTGLNVRSPFDGLSRDQLLLIAYDDRGGYTVNERRAAYCAGAQMEAEWTRGAIARGQLERSATGKHPVFMREVLDYYKALPMIEKVQDRYPWNYEAEMEAKIAEELARPAGGEHKPPGHVLNLYDMLAAMTDPANTHPTRGDSTFPNAVGSSPDLDSPPLTTNN